jgi:hypothetical protein
LLVDNLPLWLLFLLTIAFVFLSIVAGIKIGLWKRARAKDSHDAPIDAIVGALLGLLAFILTFTFGMASSRFDSRRQLLLDEVNAIGTTVLRAYMLPEPERSESIDIFREYVDLRVEAIHHPDRLAHALAASDSLQIRLWTRAISMASRMNSPIGALYVSSLNNVIDLETSRKTVVFLYRIPGAIWMGLGAITFLTMATVGFHFGLSGKPHLILCFVLALSFATVILLITELDRPRQDILRVNQGAMIELQERLRRSPS